jgi:hypothetical protein
MTELTSEGFVREGTELIRKAKESCGRDFENEMYRRKLLEVTNPKQPTQFDDDDFVNKVLQTRFIAAQGLFEDYEEVTTRKPKLGDSMGRLSVNVASEVMADFSRTKSEYAALKFDPNMEVSRIAATPREREYLKAAAELLGYTVKEDEKSGQFKVELVPYYRIGGDLNTKIETRVKVGLAGLDDDFDAEGMRRPVRRVVAAMASHMAQELRKGM